LSAFDTAVNQLLDAEPEPERDKKLDGGVGTGGLSGALFIDWRKVTIAAARFARRGKGQVSRS
jgi:hypothetical protein